MNITIAGSLGSGKTSICDIITKRYNLEVIKTGTIFRDIAAEKGVSVIELNELAKLDASIDKMLDDRSTALGKQKDNTVFDSRMAWHFIPDSFKVFVIVDLEESARRVYDGTNRNAETYKSKEEAIQGLSTRAKLERERFLSLYGVDYCSVNKYNLIIDSSYATPEQVAEEIIRNFELYKNGSFNRKVELCIPSLYPTQGTRDFSQDKLEEYLSAESSHASLCATDVVVTTIRDGYCYLLDGHLHTYIEARAGKIFTEVTMDLSDSARKRIMDVSNSTLYDIEDLAKISFRYYPNDMPKKYGFMFDF